MFVDTKKVRRATKRLFSKTNFQKRALKKTKCFVSNIFALFNLTLRYKALKKQENNNLSSVSVLRFRQVDKEEG